MTRLNPWRSGLALALAVAVLYTTCAAAFALWPQATLAFFNTWFHGLDLSALQAEAAPMTFGGFVAGLAGVTAYGFVAGLVYAVGYNLAGRCPGCRERSG